MDSQLEIIRTLPPLVEGKTHGYLELIIDEIVWTRRYPGNILIVVTWWGELDNAQFRITSRNDDYWPNKIYSEIYAVKTNTDLFKEYLNNADSIELLILSEKSQHILGVAQVIKLLDIFTGRSLSQSCPIINSAGTKVGDIRIKMKLTITKTPRKSAKGTHKKLLKPSKSSPEICLTASSTSNSMYSHKINSDKTKEKFETLDKDARFCLSENIPLKLRNMHDNNSIYRSILKDKRSDYINLTTPKSSIDITDKLVAQVVARARKLRGELTNDLKFEDGKNEDVFMYDENSSLNSFNSHESAEKEAELYEYFMGKQMSVRSEKNALETLRTQSPTPSLIEFATETIRSCTEKDLDDKEKKTTAQKYHSDHMQRHLEEEHPTGNKICLQSKEALPLDYVDSVRIVVDSLILNPAGYRRVKSSQLAGDSLPVSVTYFVQYDTMFAHIKSLNKHKNINKKISNEVKPVKMCSKRQEGSVVYFDHEGTYDFPKQYRYMDMPLKFKVFIRHINQKTPTELGIGTIYISDAAKSQLLSSTQRLAIVKKGIKIGELKVKVELGCDKVHFGKLFVEAVSSTKENIPVLELSSVRNDYPTHRYRTITGSESHNKSTAPSDNRERLTANNPGTIILNQQKNVVDQGEKNDSRGLKIQIPSGDDDKILLHGLIYIREGKDLPALTTYIICRAFWKEDRASSRICNGTSTPCYQFHQLVPLIHGPELLERTKDNCIITEVYARRTGYDDQLIGIAKLPIHQLYIALRDPLVLPHLLKSKYPVISVDGWVSITDPVTSALRGQLCALVALGTADQIALLEMTRGLRDAPAQNCPSSQAGSGGPSVREDYLRAEVPEKHYSEHLGMNRENQNAREKKSQECQTEITTVNDFKRQVSEESQSIREESTVLHTIVDRLAQALSVPRNIADQEAQTEMDFPTFDPRDRMKACSVEPLCLDGLNSNSYSVESSGSPRDNYNMPREIFRSVGVGAEFDDEANVPSNNITYSVQNDNVSNDNVESSFHSDNSRFDNEECHNAYKYERNLMTVDSNAPSADSNGGTSVEKGFGAAVEIDCALHLPQIQRNNELVDPCTYVTFQKFRNNTNRRIDAYMTTDVCPFNCNPKYDWRCDTKLSADLLIKEDKKLIMKVWRLIDPDFSMEVNIEKDIVIGCAMLDLTVLTLGFDVVSGWFHIMDAAGKCNGQLKVSVTPLDDISVFGKILEVTPRVPTISHININRPGTSMYSTQELATITKANSLDKQQHGNNNGGQIAVEPLMDIGFNLGDASMAFLSQSLKKKLSELDEIKQRLQSRLQDVTNTAFDDFENDFDLDHEGGDHGNDEKNGNNSDNNIRNNIPDNLPWLSQPLDNHLANHEINADRTTTNGNRDRTHNDHYIPLSSSDTNTVGHDINLPDTGYSSSSNHHSMQNLTNGNGVHENSNLNSYPRLRTHVINYQSAQLDSVSKNFNNDAPNSQSLHLNTNPSISRPENQFNEADYPIRGTRMHINHLLDKLSTQLSSAPPPITNLPMKRNIMDLITSLRRNNNNFSNNVKCNREANVRTVPTQTDVNYVGDSPFDNSQNDRDDAEIPAKTQRREKISTVIREELIADDNNDTADYDYLSTHLMSSNIRMGFGVNGMNPLLYPHIIPDLSISGNGTPDGREVRQIESSPNFTPEGEAIERLDNRYVETFNATLNKGLERLRDQSRSTECGTSGTIVQPQSQESATAVDSAEAFRVTQSGVMESIDGNIDVTVIHKPCNDDLMASNSIESTVTPTSFDNNTQTPSEIDDDSSLNSSETSVFVVSRQAPDGGNPIEDVNKSTYVSSSKCNNQSTDSSSAES